MKRSFYFFIALFLIAFFLIGCLKSENVDKKDSIVDFYVWRTIFSLSSKELDILRTYNTGKLYIRFFDLDYNEDKIAISNPIRFHSSPPADIEVVPVIYITRDALRQVKRFGSALIANRLLKGIKLITDSILLPNPKEIQIDCDWTASTRDSYFELLNAIRKEAKQRNANPRLTATIRLHQIKYLTSSGIPPVNSGVLMIYGTGIPSELNGPSPILNRKIVMSYLRYLKRYPLPLRVAWPAFFYLAHFNSDGRFIRLLPSKEIDLRNYTELAKVSKDIYKAKMDLYIEDEPFLQGDLLRFSIPDPNDIRFLRKYAFRMLPRQDGPEIFFHLESSILRRYLP